jgi:hypothetical protein
MGFFVAAFVREAGSRAMHLTEEDADGDNEWNGFEEIDEPQLPGENTDGPVLPEPKKSKNKKTKKRKTGAE